MENCKRDKVKCVCPNKDCPRHGKCCDCVAAHRDEMKNLPVCLRSL